MRTTFLSWSGMMAGSIVWTLLSPASHSQSQSSSAHGNEVFQYWCSNCHGAGPGHPGTTALQAKYKGTPPALLELRTDLTAETVKFYVRHGLSVMPVFRKTEISDADLDDVAAYLSKSKN